MSESADAIREFQETFGPYFPALLDNAGAAARQMDWLENRALGNAVETVRSGTAKRDISKALAAFKALGRLDTSYRLPLNFALHLAEREGDEDAQRVGELMRILATLGEWRASGSLGPALARFEHEAIVAIEQLPERGAASWEAILAVDALRTLWRSNRGRNAPKALNRASTFARFLDDGFRWLEIEAHPPSAFKAWAKKYPTSRGKNL